MKLRQKRKRKKERRAKMGNGRPFNAKPPRMAQRSIAANILPGVQAKDLAPIVCNNCGGTQYYPVHSLMAASRFQSVNGLPTLVQFPSGFACTKCNKVNPFDPAKIGESVGEKVEKEEKFNCPECKSKGFKPSITGTGCTFCDGTEGGNPPETKKEEIKEEPSVGGDLGINVGEDVTTKEALK